jgi:hypothetical protein
LTRHVRPKRPCLPAIVAEEQKTTIHGGTQRLRCAHNDLMVSWLSILGQQNSVTLTLTTELAYFTNQAAKNKPYFFRE